MDAEALKRWKIETHGLRNEYDLMAWDALGFILHRQWLYESNAPGYGCRRSAAYHLGDLIKRAVKDAGNTPPAAPARTEE